MLVKNHYRRLIREVMAEHGIKPALSPPSHVVPQNATFARVVRYTDFYIGKGNNYPNARSHYRYHRYIGTLRWLMLLYPTVFERRMAHVDIGCGAGLFSWVLLDWATEQGVGHGRVDLYGLDHSPAVLDLARMVRDKLTQQTASYPKLHYCEDVDALIRELKINYRKDTDFTITFGHVLAQTHTHTPSDIDNFAQLIVYIRNKLMDARSKCYLVAVDARSGIMGFTAGWNSLLENLESAGIQSEDSPFMVDDSAKLTRLYSA